MIWFARRRGGGRSPRVVVLFGVWECRGALLGCGWFQAQRDGAILCDGMIRDPSGDVPEFFSWVAIPDEAGSDVIDFNFEALRQVVRSDLRAGRLGFS